MAEVTTAAEKLEELSSIADQQVVSFTLTDGSTLDFVQAPLGVFQKLELFAHIGQVIDNATQGDNPIVLSEIFTPTSSGSGNDLITDELIRGVAKLAQFAPNVLQKSICIVLGVPHHQRDAVIEGMSVAPSRGGLTDDQTIDILNTFIKQNAKDIKDFLTEKIGLLSKTWKAAAGTDSKQSSKPSKPTRRSTAKR